MRSWAPLALSFTLACSSAPTPVNVPPQDEPVIGPAGGTVVGQGAIEGAQLNIPAGALGQETPIEIGADPDAPSPPLGYTPAGPSILCSPEGFVFLEAATLVIPYAGLGDVTMFWAPGGDGQVWQYFDGGSANDTSHTIDVSIAHFSRYQPFRPLGDLAPDGGLIGDGGDD